MANLTLDAVEDELKQRHVGLVLLILKSIDQGFHGAVPRRIKRIVAPTGLWLG